MQNPIVVAALMSAVISAIVSAGTSFLTVNLEKDKLVVAAQQSALQQVIRARLEAYPLAYQLVSQMEKDASEKLIDREYLETLRSAFDEWDSSNAHLLGPDSTNIVYAFRQQLLTAISESKRGDFDREKLLDLLRYAEQVELALRGDLGIYGFQLQGPDPELIMPIPSKY